MQTKTEIIEKVSPNIEEKKKTRALALDALRGFAILTMILSGVVPWSSLPAFMYHAQTPPPTRAFNPNIPGITWVDLVFPFFLFSMGAAMPIAISNRLKKGVSYFKTIFYIFERGFLLFAFALFRPMINPWAINENPTYLTNLLALIGFIILFGMYVRFPDKWNTKIKTLLRLAGWTAAIIYMSQITMSDGTGFQKNRNDIIILVLANMAVFGSLIWLITQKSVMLRLGIMGIYLAIRITSDVSGPNWVRELYLFPKSFDWIYAMGFLKYLFIVIPGTIIGDMLLKWMKDRNNQGTQKGNWSSNRFILIASLMFAFILVELTGLFARWIWQTTLFSFALCLLGWYLTKDPKNEDEKFIKNIYLWGTYWLILGLFFEPYEGGIKKDPSTLSYYFITTGLAIYMLAGFTIVIDIMQKRKGMGLLIDNGQNPMIAYVGFSNFVGPILVLTYIDNIVSPIFISPWMGFIYAVIKTLLVGFMVTFFTKKKIFWRT